MKRLFLRIALLALIVTLGLITIAQAQLGTSKTPPTTAYRSAGNDGTPLPLGNTSGASSLANEPRRLSAPGPTNPLRTNDPASSGGVGIRATSLSAQGDPTTAQVPELLAVPSTESAPVQRVADPLGEPPMLAPSAEAEPLASAPTSGTPGPMWAPPQASPGQGPSPSAAAGLMGGTVGVAVPPEPSSSVPGGSPLLQRLAPSARSAPSAEAVALAPSATSSPALDPFGDRSPATASAPPASAAPLQASLQPSTIPDNLPEPALSESAASPPAMRLTVGTGTSFPMGGEPAPIGAASEQALPMGTQAAGGQGTGTPGQSHLEGLQAPQLSIQKLAPPEIQVGRPAKFQVKVRNTGATPAQNVEVRDQVPRGTQLVATTPRASQTPRGELLWSLGPLRPGEEASVEMEVLPTAEGEIGSVASVSFNAEASAKTIATRPQLVVKTSVPRQVLLGEEVILSITVSNPGTGVAENVVIEEHVPAGLQHVAGTELENEIGTLRPGESRQLELRMTANQAGTITNVLAVRAGNNLRADDKTQLEVLAPQLEVALEGPKRRYLEREAVYTVQISNPGTAPAHQVELIAQLPAGLKFVNANNAGSYDPNTQTVHWLLEELPVRESGSVQLTALPIAPGEQTIRVRGSAQRGLQSEKSHSVLIEGIAAIFFEVVDVADPIEVNGKTSYEIRVVNQGSKAATNVQVVAEFPAGMRPLTAEGARYNASGNSLVFEPLARLAPKADTTYRIQAQGVQAGDQRIRVLLKTDELQQPVTKEESTRVYSDG